MTPQGLLEYVEPRDLRPHDVVLVPLTVATRPLGLHFCVVTKKTLGGSPGAFGFVLQHWKLRNFQCDLTKPVLVLIGAEGGRHSWPQELKRPMLVLPRRP